MILRELAVMIDIPKLDEAIIDYTYEFYTKSRHICNYVETECLTRLKFKTDNYKKIVISLSNNPEPPLVNSCAVLCLPIAFDKSRYDSLEGDDQFRDYVHSKITSPLKEYAKEFDIPYKEILQSIDQLRKNDYVNCWIFKEKSDRRRRYKAALWCDLKIDGFELRLRVSEKGEEFYNSVILETSANELTYDAYFKDIVFVDDEIQISDRMGGVLHSLPLPVV